MDFSPSLGNSAGARTLYGLSPSRAGGFNKRLTEDGGICRYVSIWVLAMFLADLSSDHNHPWDRDLPAG